MLNTKMYFSVKVLKHFKHFLHCFEMFLKISLKKINKLCIQNKGRKHYSKPLNKGNYISIKKRRQSTRKVQRSPSPLKPLIGLLLD